MGAQSPQADALPPDGSGEQSDTPTSRTFHSVPGFTSPQYVTAAILCVAAIHWSKPILLPVIVAWIGKILCAPVVRRARSWGLPNPVGAALIVGVLAACGGLIGYHLAEPAENWLSNLPGAMAKLITKLQAIAKPVEEVSEAATRIVESVEETVQPRDAAIPVEVRGERSPIPDLFDGAQTILASLAASAALLVLMLASDGAFFSKVVDLLPRAEDKRCVLRMLQSVEQNVCRYLARVLFINVTLGATIAVSLWFVGMPNPALWGAMAALLNFIPYLGPIAGIVIVGAAALLSMEDSGAALMAPVVYLAWNVLEGFVVTPVVIGRTFSMSSVVVFVWFLAWSWLWGICGALLAVPLLAATKIALDAFSATRPIGRLLAR